MASNKLIIFFVGILAVALIVVVVNKTNSPKHTDESASNTPKTPVAVKEVSGDTVNETLKETQGKLTELRDENDQDRKALQDEIARLREDVKSAENRRDLELREAKERTANEAANTIREQIEAAKRELSEGASNARQLANEFSATKNENANAAPTTPQYQFNDSELGLDGQSQVLSGFSGTMLPGYVSLQPLKRPTLANSSVGAGQAQSNGGLAAPEQAQLGLNGQTGGASGQSQSDKKPKNRSIPYYTLHANSTAMDATAMTAMIGRVPVGGRAGDRFPVKFVLGDDTLSANGHRIPGLKGVIFSGLATGNWNLSCVSVALTSATFVFKDNRIQHLPSNVKTDAEGLAIDQEISDPLATDGSKKVSEAIGYISTPEGVPCIGGKRITDAEKQLFTMGVLGAARSYFDAKAAAETTRISDLSSGVTGSVVTGDTVKFANNQTVANSVGTVMDFYKDRVRDSFDVIFVEPGKKVALHIEKDLLVDYNTQARKVVYDHSKSKNIATLD